jgi:membrane dipeptidase
MLSSLALTTASAALFPRISFASETERWKKYNQSIVIDSLGGPDTPFDSAQIAAIKASGLTAVNLTVTEDVGSYPHAYDSALEGLALWNAKIAAYPDVLMPVLQAADIRKAKESGRLGLIYGFQDATPFDEDLDRLNTFRNAGVRIFQLTYNLRNLVGDGCLEPGNAGLSRFGRQLVERLNASRSLVDLSHAGERTTLEAIQASKSPIAISHSGCAAIAPNPRNKTDNELRQLAIKGGYVGIYFMPFLRSQGQPFAEDLIKHIDHAINICGEDHVGLGSDGNIAPVDLTPEYKKNFAEVVLRRRKLGISAPGEDPEVYLLLPDLNVPDRFSKLAYLLSRRGYSDARIEKIIGGNFQQLLQNVWGS